MKLILSRISEGEEDVIIRYREMNEKIGTIISFLQGTGQKISAEFEGQTALLEPEKIFYLESVDGNVFAYLEDKVCRVSASLEKISLCFEERGLFRCAKSMVINIYKIRYLRSEPGNRIRATMDNGEQVMISRKYAKRLRRILKGGTDRDESV